MKLKEKIVNQIEVDYVKLIGLSALLLATGSKEESWKFIKEANDDLFARAPEDVREEFLELFEKHFAKPFSNITDIRHSNV